MRGMDFGATPEGAQEFRPRLRLVGNPRPVRRDVPTIGPRLPRTVAVASGKGGVGKTSITLNLALSLAELHQRVLVVDGDFGLGKLDLLLGANPQLNLGHVLDGDCDVEDAVFIGPRGVCFLPGACGAGDLAVLDRNRRDRFLSALEHFSGTMDLILLDLATGIGPNSVELARRASEVMLVTTPEPTAYADAYALIKILAGRGPATHSVPPRVVVNRARNDEEAQSTYLRLSRTARRHLGTAPLFWGTILEDPAVEDAVRRQKPFSLTHPDSPASRRIRELAWRLLRGKNPDGGERAGLGVGEDAAVPSTRVGHADRRPPLWEAA